MGFGWMAGWVGLALVLALAHRRRRPRSSMPWEVEAFLLRLQGSLQRRHPEVGYLGLLPGRFACLLRVAGQETAVALHESLRRAAAFPEAFDQLVDQLVADVEEVGLERLPDQAFAAARIMPQVRSRAWLDQQQRFGDSALVHRSLARDLVLVYVIDHVEHMLFVCRGHLRRWGRQEEDLFALARTNLQRLTAASLPVPGADAGPILLRSGDGYDAARVLLLDRAADGMLVAVPDRDTLWLGRETGQDLGGLMATTAGLALRAARPVSPTLYRFCSGQLQAVSAGSPLEGVLAPAP